MKAVFDTNVLVSALAFGGKPLEVLELAISEKVKLVISNVLLDELKGVLGGPKFRYPQPIIDLMIDQFMAIVELVKPRREISRIVTDPDDNRVLECAVEGEVDYIVSGDPDLLDLEAFEGITICTPAQFLSQNQIHNPLKNE